MDLDRLVWVAVVAGVHLAALEVLAVVEALAALTNTYSCDSHK